jgi:hypothetical protein
VQKRLIIVGVVVLGLAVGSLALADDESDRKNLIEDIEDELEEAADDLEDLDDESSSSQVGEADRHIETMSGLVDKLANVKGDDSTANYMVDRYRGWVGPFRESTGALRKLKDGQPTLREMAGVCTTLDKQLGEQIASYVGKEDPAGAEELPKLGESLRRNVDDRWKTADEMRRNMERWRETAKRFSESHGEWSGVRSALHASADDVFRAWEGDWKLGEQACVDLRRGKDHPKIEEAVKQLATFAKGRDELIKEAEATLDAAAQLLSGSEGDSDDGDLVAAQNKAADLEQTLARLARAKGADRRAGEIAEKWPRYVEAYKFATRQLVELKRSQFVLGNAVTRCKADDEALGDFLGRYQDPSGIPAIEAKATEMQAPIVIALDKAREQNNRMSQWNDNAQKLNLSEGKWSYVSGYVRSAAQGMFEQWRKSLELAEQACGNLAKGTAHPKVEQTVKMLRGRTPPQARHQSKHDSTCTGMPAGGFCMADDQCLDGTCASNKCTQCPARDDGRCHPPGTCSQSDFDGRYAQMKTECGKPRSPTTQMDCRTLAELCNNAQACVTQRLHVQECFRGGDSRHMEELNTAREVAAKCEEILKDKRDRKLCD